jgi:hypothetical protein
MYRGVEDVLKNDNEECINCLNQGFTITQCVFRKYCEKPSIELESKIDKGGGRENYTKFVMLYSSLDNNNDNNDFKFLDIKFATPYDFNINDILVFFSGSHVSDDYSKYIPNISRFEKKYEEDYLYGVRGVVIHKGERRGYCVGDKAFIEVATYNKAGNVIMSDNYKVETADCSYLELTHDKLDKIIKEKIIDGYYKK